MAAPTSSYTLYHYRHSICSIMVRYCIAIRGKPREGLSEVSFTEKEVEIMTKYEQISEDFLCDINPKGQVPVLKGQETISDSVRITHHLADLFPSLIPESHREQMTRLIKELHDINFFSLSFADRPQVPSRIADDINDRLKGEISSRYRKALEYKLQVLQDEKVDAIAPAYVKAMNDLAREQMKAFEKHLPDNAEWLFGLDQPSAVDAHLVTFISRMMDMNRGDVIPSRLVTYAEAAWATPEWQGVIQGRKSMVDRI